MVPAAVPAAPAAASTPGVNRIAATPAAFQEGTLSSAPFPTLDRLWLGTERFPGAAVRHWKVTVPVVLGTAALMAFADRPIARDVGTASFQVGSRKASNAMLLIATPAEVVADGLLLHREQPFWGTVESAGVTALYATAVVQAMKYGAGRERPYIGGDGNGAFFEHGNSFPSGHSLAAFSIASLLAHRYPQHRWVAITAYSLAAGIAVARVLAWKHFPSDVFFGGVMGTALGACAATCR